MDATVTQVLLGVATNIFSATLERSMTDAMEGDVESAIESAVREFVARVDLGKELGRERLVDFLEGAQVATAFRMLFIANANNETRTRGEVETEFIRAFTTSFTDQPESEARKLFVGLHGITEAVLETMAEEGSAEAEQRLDSYRFGFLKEELAGLKASIDDLKQTPRFKPEELNAWEQLYRSQVQARHGTIVPPSLDTADRIPIDQIYLHPTFRLERSGVDDARLGTDDLARCLSRAVVLGDPGAGKSTFATKLAFDLARKQVKLPGGSPIPFLVDMKEYGAEKHRTHTSIAEWLETIARSDYSAPAPAGAIEWLLSTGRIALICDGLDELLDTAHRRQITADVETFASRYVAAPILVTSRRVGYPQAPLDPRRFDAYGLNELGDGQIRRYVSVWFGLRRELGEKARVEMTKTFLEDSAESAADLRRNMLMLGLLCNLYRGEGYIPRHRPQVYEKCAVMLFERWDKGRKIVVELEFERHLRPAMQHLAHWIYSEPSLRSGVSEAELVKSTTEFLLERRFEDRAEARAEALRFVEFCRGRAWVFTDTGTTREGDRLYQFTHRTFLEFFTAEHLVRNESTPGALLSVLLPHIATGEWDVVAQLACQLQDDNVDGAADALLDSLVKGDGGAEERELMCSFAARGLAFLVPRRETCRTVARAVTAQTISWLIDGRDRLVSDFAVYPPDTHQALVRVDRENFQPVSHEMLARVRDFLAEDPEDVERALASAEIALNADIALHGTNDSPDRVIAFTRAAADVLWPMLKNHVATDASLAYDGFWFGEVGIEVLLARYSAKILFYSRDFSLSDYTRQSPIQAMFDGQMGGLRRPDGSTIGDVAELETVGAALESEAYPWDTRSVHYIGLLDDTPRLTPRDEVAGSALFGAFGALAWTAEQMFHGGEIDLMINALRQSDGWVHRLSPYVLNRFDADQVELPALDCGERAGILIDTWAKGGWSATSPPLDGEPDAMRSGLID